MRWFFLTARACGVSLQVEEARKYPAGNGSETVIECGPDGRLGPALLDLAVGLAQVYGLELATASAGMVAALAGLGARS